MNYATKLEPRSCIVLSLFVEVYVVELSYELQCVTHLVEKKRKKYLTHTVVELLKLGHCIELSVCVCSVAVGQYIVGVACEKTSKVEYRSEPARVVSGSSQCIVVLQINIVIACSYKFIYTFVAPFEKVVQVEPHEK